MGEQHLQRWRTPKREQKETGATGVQNKCVDWARAQGWWARKFVAPGRRSLPDYLFAKIIDGEDVKLAVEFKKKGKPATEQQLEEHKTMRAAGWEVYVIDDVRAFKILFSQFEQASDWLS